MAFFCERQISCQAAGVNEVLKNTASRGVSVCVRVCVPVTVNETIYLRAHRNATERNAKHHLGVE